MLVLVVIRLLDPGVVESSCVCCFVGPGLSGSWCGYSRVIPVMC